MSNNLFSADTDWTNNACLNWSHDSIGLYISGYKEAADILVSKVIETSSDQDILVYPIAFLYRQYIELQLKSIIKDSRHILEDGAGFPEHHKIKDLWCEAKRLMKNIINNLDKTADEYITKNDLKIIENIINDFVAIDPISFSFRYPTDKQGKTNLEGLTHINLRKLGQQIGLLSESLDKFDLVIGLIDEWQSDMKGTYGP